MNVFQWADDVCKRAGFDGHVMASTYAPGKGSVDFFAKTRAEVATLLRTIRGKWEKNDPADSEYSATKAIWSQKIGGIQVDINIDRGQVCERVEVGRHMEDVEVAVETRIEQREVIEYEWRCKPVLAEQDGEVAA